MKFIKTHGDNSYTGCIRLDDVSAFYVVQLDKKKFALKILFRDGNDVFNYYPSREEAETALEEILNAIKGEFVV